MAAISGNHIVTRCFGMKVESPGNFPPAKLLGGEGRIPRAWDLPVMPYGFKLGRVTVTFCPSALLEMFHEFSIICQEFLPETRVLRWLSPLIILVSCGVQLDLCSFNQCPLTWIFLDESWHPYPPYSFFLFFFDLEGLLFIGPKLQNWSSLQSAEHWSLHPNHPIHLVVLAVTDLLTCCSTMDLNHPKPEGSDSQPSERVALQCSSSFLQVH